MFGVGIHFSLRDLLSVRAVAIPGAIGQSLVATLLGAGSGSLGWGVVGGLVLGLAVSVASTVVLLRALEEGDLLETPAGPGRRGLADRRGPVHGARAGAAADPRAHAPAATAAGIGDVGLGLGSRWRSSAVFAVLMLVVGVRFVPVAPEYV